MKVSIKGLELTAIALVALMVWTPLFTAPHYDAVLTPLAVRESSNYYQHKSTGSDNNGDYIVAGGVLIALLNLLVIGYQSTIFGRQTKLMEGQLRATEVAANAALAALDRPWLVVEGLNQNEANWLDAKQPLVAEFRIANYGRAPAFIKKLIVFHFRGPDHRDGRPPFELPIEVLDFPDAKSLVSFLGQWGRVPFLRGEEIAGATEMNWPLKYIENEFVLGGSDKTDIFCVVGYRKLDENENSGIPIMAVTESYLIGYMYYEFPGQAAEIMRFSYHNMHGRNFALYRDYPPYNERKRA